MAQDMAHPELHLLLEKLRSTYESLLNFKPLVSSPPILDSSVADPADDGQWLQPEPIPGLKKLREALKFDIDTLHKAGAARQSHSIARVGLTRTSSSSSRTPRARAHRRCRSTRRTCSRCITSYCVRRPPSCPCSNLCSWTPPSGASAGRKGHRRPRWTSSWKMGGAGFV